MPAAILGLVSALVYGSADFVGGVASRAVGPLRTTAIGAVAGLALLVVALPAVGGTWSAAALGWGAASGAIGAAAVALLYACLAIGPMSILSPLTALVSALVPLAWGLAGGDQFAPIGYAALGLALVAVVLVGFVPERGAVRPSARALTMAVAAGTLIGIFLIVLDRTPADSGLVPLVANRAVDALITWSVIGLLALRGIRRTSSRRGVLLAVASGLLDASANTLILVGLRAGDLSTMSVLVALYPAGTIVLAAAVLRERIAPVQWVGLVLAITGAAMLSVA